MVGVVRYFISTLFGSYGSRSTKGSSEKKPYNPVLGEQFFASYKSNDGSVDTFLTCEQVCHHPPITGFHLENKKAGVELTGFCGQKTKFKTTTIKLEQTGRMRITIPGLSESYYLHNYPEIYIRSLLSGTPFLELAGSVCITSTTGYMLTLDFPLKVCLGDDCAFSLHCTLILIGHASLYSPGLGANTTTSKVPLQRQTIQRCRCIRCAVDGTRRCILWTVQLV